MKLLLVTNIHEPLSLISGGGMERSSHFFITMLAKYLENRSLGLSVSVFSHSDSLIPNCFDHIESSFENVDSKYNEFGDGKAKWNIYAGEKSVLGLADGLSKFDVVHDMSSLFSLPFICNQFSIPYLRTLRLMPYHPVYKLTAEKCAFQVFLSYYQASFVNQNISKFEIIPDFIESKSNRAIHIKDEYCVIVGRVETRKGINESLEICRYLNLKAVIIGKITDENYYNTLLHDYKEKVIFTGYLKHENVLEKISKAKFLVWTPSVPEPGGRVVLESLCAGTSVIANYNGYAADIVNKNNDLNNSFKLMNTVYYILHPSNISLNTEETFIGRYIEIYNSIKKQ